MNLHFESITDSVGNKSIVVFEHDKYATPIVVLNAYSIVMLLKKLKYNSELLYAINDMYSDMKIEFKK